MKLQKLVFFVHAWGLALLDRPITEERPQAWDYGPVYSSIYQSAKGFGSAPVTRYLSAFDVSSGEFKHLIPSYSDTQFWSLLERVWERYGSLSAMSLSALTHEPGSPWEDARHGAHSFIDDKSIKSFYRRQLTQHGRHQHA